MLAPEGVARRVGERTAVARAGRTRALARDVDAPPAAPQALAEHVAAARPPRRRAVAAQRANRGAAARPVAVAVARAALGARSEVERHVVPVRGPHAAATSQSMTTTAVNPTTVYPARMQISARNQ